MKNEKNEIKRIYNKKTTGQKMAEKASQIIGSWTFITGQTIFIIGWIVLNSVGMAKGWDIYPFVFLNLLLSITATYAAPVILMAQNRDAERDRQRAIIDLATDRKSARGIEEIKKIVGRIERKINQS